MTTITKPCGACDGTGSIRAAYLEETLEIVRRKGRLHSTDLARALGITNANAIGRLNLLRRLGYAEREKDPGPEKPLYLWSAKESGNV